MKVFSKDAFKMADRFNRVFFTELALCVLLVINVFSQSFLDRFIPLPDLLFGVFLFLYLVVASKWILRLSRGEALFILFILFFSLLSVSFSEDRVYTLKRLFSLVTQTVTVPLLTLSVARRASQNDLRSVLSSKLVKILLIVLGVSNIALMLVASLMKTFEIGGVEVGNYISQRYFGFQNTPAFASGLSLCLLYCGFSSRGRFAIVWKLLSLLSVGLTYLLSEARAGLVAIVVFLACYLLLALCKGKHLHRYVLGTIIFLGVVLLFCVIFRDRLDLDKLSSYRLSLWKIALKNANPWLGNSASFITIRTSADIFEGGAHNALIQFVYMCGWPATVALFGFVFARLGRALSGVRSMWLSGSQYFGEYISLISLAISIFAFCMFESHLLMVRCTISFMFFYALYRIKLISMLLSSGKVEP